MSNEISLKDISKIKEILKFLNDKFPTLDKKIIAYFPDKDEFQAWHIINSDYWRQTDKKYNSMLKFLHIKYKIKFFACYLHPATIMMLKKKIILR